MEIKNFFLLTLTTLSPGASRAHPGMLEALAGYSRASEKRDTTELLADLKTLPDSALSPAGLTIKNILLANHAAASPQDLNTVYKPPGPLGSSECRDDTCCVWKYIADAMAAVFQESDDSDDSDDDSKDEGDDDDNGTSQKQCNELARQAVRLGFHDAGTWSKSLGGGGADGSVVLSATELARSDNRGLEIAAARMAGWYTEYRSYGVSMADLIQVGAAVATVSCPLGPRSRVFVGRNDSNTPAPSGRLPSVDADAKSLVELFADKTIGVSELVALVGAHTASVQRFVDPLRLGSPQDSTPGTWDVLFYNQMISANPPADVFQFPSDLALSRYSAARESWQTFANGQAVWNDVSFLPPRPLDSF